MQTLPRIDLGQTTSNTCTNHSNKKRCEPSCCTQKQIPLHISWAKTIYSVQGHNAGPTPTNQKPNAIPRISIHLGERKHEALNPVITYMAISRATTIGCLGHMATIPKTCMNSALYFLGGAFSSGIKCLKHTHIPTKKNLSR
jgi:hypothetical protein